MTFEEAVLTAIKLEKKIQGVYAQAGREAKNPVGKRVFGLLAAEESRHVKYLEKNLSTYKSVGRIDAEKLETTLPAQEKILEEVAKLKQKLEGSDVAKELELLRRAEEVETETSTFYRDTVATLDGEAKAFFEQFVAIEQGHLALVTAEINALTGMGFWFDMPEFDLEGA